MNEQLTQWYAKEQAGLLAVETEERRDQRRLAEDPATTSAMLADLGRQALEDRTTDRFAWFRYLENLRKNSAGNNGEWDNGAPLWKHAPWRRSELLFQALAAHPNTPSDLLAELIGTTPLIPQVTSAFLRNPTATFLLLEQPPFFKKLDVFCQLLLLREVNVPQLFVEQVAQGKDAPEEKAAQAAAQMHILLAGEVTEDQTGSAQMRTYWQGQWSAITPYSRTHKWQANLLPEMAQSPRWTDRLDAASRAEATNTPMSEDFFDRSGLEMLHHLASDGNRFVRWTARNRLAMKKA